MKNRTPPSIFHSRENKYQVLLAVSLFLKLSEVCSTQFDSSIRFDSPIHPISSSRFDSTPGQLLTVDVVFLFFGIVRGAFNSILFLSILKNMHVVSSDRFSIPAQKLIIVVVVFHWMKNGTAPLPFFITGKTITNISTTYFFSKLSGVRSIQFDSFRFSNTCYFK